MQSLEERLEEIVNISYRILCNKIAGNTIFVENEASLQLQLGVILSSIGRLYEFSQDDRFSIILEKKIEGIDTCKSKGKARCDIYLELSNSKETSSVGIELKYFPKKETITPTTENRFSILMDIENLERYKATNVITSGYVIVLTTDKNYQNSQTRSSIKIGNGGVVGGTIESNNDTVVLSGEYVFNWDEFVSDTTISNYFLKLKV